MVPGWIAEDNWKEMLRHAVRFESVKDAAAKSFGLHYNRRAMMLGRWMAQHRDDEDDEEDQVDDAQDEAVEGDEGSSGVAEAMDTAISGMQSDDQLSNPFSASTTQTDVQDAGITNIASSSIGPVAVIQGDITPRKRKKQRLARPKAWEDPSDVLELRNIENPQQVDQQLEEYLNRVRQELHDTSEAERDRAKLIAETKAVKKKTGRVAEEGTSDRRGEAEFGTRKRGQRQLVEDLPRCWPARN